MSEAIKLIGQAAGVVNGALAIFKPNGKTAEITVSPESGHLVVATGSNEDADRVAAVVGGLVPDGDRRAALQALYPHLPTGHLAAALAFVDGLTEAVTDDGQIDAGEIMAIVASVLKEAQ